MIFENQGPRLVEESFKFANFNRAVVESQKQKKN